MAVLVVPRPVRDLRCKRESDFAPRADMLVNVKDEARLLLLDVIHRYQTAGSPDRGGWYFDVGQISEAHRDLEAAGLTQRAFGVAGGFAWRLTELGIERAKQPA